MRLRVLALRIVALRIVVLRCLALRCLAVLFLVPGLGCGVRSSADPLRGSADSGRPAALGAVRGSLFIVGGGSAAPDLVAQFVELAGGARRARVAVIPMASSEPEETGREKVAELRRLGADAFSLHVSRREADADSVVRLLDSVTGVWFSGGDQTRLAPVLRGTAALAAIHARYRAGAVIGGTSAGAAIMSDSMITGEQYRADDDTSTYYGDEFPTVARGAIEIVPGLGFLSNAIVDQHFIRRERHNRLLSVVLERPALLGLGIDQDTAVHVDPDGRWSIRGIGAVIIYDARRARITAPEARRLGGASVSLHVLPAGSSYDPRSGRATLPGEI